MTKPRLAVVMIVRDAQDWLPGCIESVRPVADEIVVGDTGSSDGAASVADSLGARLISVPWQDDFAAARNAVLAGTDADWLLHMDADEALDDRCAAETKRLVREGGADAYEVTLANYTDDPRSWRWIAADPNDPRSRGYSGYVATHIPRLFRNGRGFEYRERIHESITESIEERGGVIAPSNIVIHHYGFASGAKSPEKRAYYRELCARKVRERPKDPKAWHEWGVQLIEGGDSDEGAHALEQALALAPDYAPALMTLANHRLKTGAWDAARDLLERSLRCGLRNGAVEAALAAIDIREGGPETARDRLEAAARHDPQSLLLWLTLARAWDCMGGAEQARAALDRAARLAPNAPMVQDRLAAHADRENGRQALEAGQAKTGLTQLVAAARRDPEDPVIHLLMARGLTLLGAGERAQRTRAFADKLCPGVSARLS